MLAYGCHKLVKLTIRYTKVSISISPTLPQKKTWLSPTRFIYFASLLCLEPDHSAGAIQA